MNYFSVKTDEDNKQAICATLPLYSVFFASTHGDKGTFMDCVATADDSDLLPDGMPAHQISSSLNMIDQLSIPGVVVAQRANPNLPPFNYVDLQACDVGDDASFATAFGIPMGSTNIFDDRALLSWPGEINCDYSLDSWTYNFWDFLQKGQTLIDANVIADASYPVMTNTGLFATIDPVIFGDKTMKLHGVYGIVGSDQWYRPL